MDEVLTETEKLMLFKVFEGDFPPFKVLAKQINGLAVKNRRKDYHTYDVEFFADKNMVTRLVGHEENIEVSGTLMHINESEVMLNVSVRVIDGYIDYLLIGGDFHFEKYDFTVKNVVWRNRNDDPLKEGTIVYNASERDFKKSVGYIPMYK